MPPKARARATPGSRRTTKPRTASARPPGAPARPGARRPHTRAGAGGARPRVGAQAPRKLPRPGAARAKRGKFAPPDPERVRAMLTILDRAYPAARCALDFGTPLQLLIATILSAQCTDVRVNMVTPALFERYPDAAALAAVPQAELEERIRSTGFFRNKARAIRECCADIVARHGGEVPRTMEDLVRLRGVGRKTANVVLGNAFGIPGIVVDTHVTRLANRLGLTNESDAVKIEYALMPVVPRERWTVFSHWLILHGRSTCIARKPRCSNCPLLPHCPRTGVTSSV
jgi:endonuclease-3